MGWMFILSPLHTQEFYNFAAGLRHLHVEIFVQISLLFQNHMCLRRLVRIIFP